MPIVYMLHFHSPPSRGHQAPHGHFLGIVDREDQIDVGQARHGHGWRLLAAGTAEISDVWVCDSPAQAEKLRMRLVKVGSRRRMCSICTPMVGAGRGNWSREGRTGTGALRWRVSGEAWQVARRAARELAEAGEGPISE